MSKIVGRMSIVSTQASSVFALLLVGRLDEQRHGRDLSSVLPVQAAALARMRERHAVVGGHDDQRVVPEAVVLQVLPQVLELEVGEPGLEEMALEQHVQLARVLVGLVRQAGDHVVRRLAVALAGGQVLPGHVRHQRVLEVQRGPASRHDVVDPLLEAHRAPAVQVGARVPGRGIAAHLRLVAAAAEVPPVLGDAREIVLDVRRRDHVQPDEPEVLGHRRDPAAVRLLGVRVLAEVAASRPRWPPRSRSSGGSWRTA